MRYTTIAILLLLTAASGPGHAQMPHIVGSWELDIAASTLPRTPPQSQVRTYLPLEDGYLLGIAITVDPQGRAGFLQFAARPDGEDYPEYNPITLAALQMTGEQTSATYGETPIDEFTVAWVDKNDGVAYASGTRQVSEDGSILTIEAQFQDPDGGLASFTLVFNKL